MYTDRVWWENSSAARDMLFAHTEEQIALFYCSLSLAASCPRNSDSAKREEIRERRAIMKGEGKCSSNLGTCRSEDEVYCQNETNESTILYHV